MELKFFLNKFLRVDNIEGYTLSTLEELRKVHDKFLDESEGNDPDFPGINFRGGGNGIQVKGVNKAKLEEMGEEL